MPRNNTIKDKKCPPYPSPQVDINTNPYPNLKGNPNRNAKLKVTTRSFTLRLSVTSWHLSILSIHLITPISEHNWECSEQMVLISKLCKKNAVVLRLKPPIFQVKTIPTSSKKYETKVVGCKLAIDKVGDMFTINGMFTIKICLPSFAIFNSRVKMVKRQISFPSLGWFSIYKRNQKT